MDKMNPTFTPRFRSQWRPETQPSWAQYNDKPTCTVPDQSMTIPEIIAKFTRTGLVPRAFAQRDLGGNVAMEPDFDPMDDYTETMQDAARRRASDGGQGSPAPGTSSPQAEVGPRVAGPEAVSDKGAEGDRGAAGGGDTSGNAGN